MGAKQGIIQEPIVSKLNYSDVKDQNILNQICQRPPPFCCCFNPQNMSIMPISKLNYQVNVNLGFFTVTILQTYENNLDVLTDLEYVFITNNNAAFSKLEVELGDKKLIGLIKEKQQASSEYLKGMQKGKTMLYSYKDDGFPDLMRVKLGNLAPKSKLIVKYQYIQNLEVTVNKFWRIELVQAVHHSYLVEPQNVKAFKFLEQFIDFGSFKQNFLEDINITFDLPTPITFCQSPTHKILRKQEGNQKNNKDFIILDPDYKENFEPNKRFILLFSNKEVHQPILSLSYSDRNELKQEQYCATIAFIPQFNPLKFDDAYQAYLDQYDFDTQEFPYQSKGEYIFLLDRSRSMRRKRIKKAKEAVELFIRSLPKNSYFNVISFGGIFEKLWAESRKYSIYSAQDALEKIEDIEADLRGTKLLEPLQQIYKQQRQDGQPLNIFILTDGKVTPDPVIDLVKKNSRPNIKVYCLGIGKDCSRCLVEQVALVGNGKFHFTYDNEDLNSKVIDLLQDSMSPYLENFELRHNLEQPYCIVPNPQSVKFLKKNSQFTIQILFPRQDNKQLNFVLSYFDPQIRQQCQFNINILQAAATKSEQYHKLAAFKQIQILEDAFQQRAEYVENLLISKEDVYVQDIVGISLTHQVLSRETAFLCEIAGPKKNLKKMLKQKVIEFDEYSVNEYQICESKKEKRNWCDIDSDKYREKQYQDQDDLINNEFYDDLSHKLINVPAFIKKRSEQKYLREQEYKKEQEQLIIQKELEIEYQNKIQQRKQNEMKITAIKILKYAQIDGQFDQEVLNLFQFQSFTIQNGLTEQQWIDIFVINYLYLKCFQQKGAWQLIVKKTEENLRRNNIKNQTYREETLKLIKEIQ